MTSNGIHELFSNEVKLTHPVTAKQTKDTLVVCLVEGDYNKHTYTLYLYNVKENCYHGFINLSSHIGLQLLEGIKIVPMDYWINEHGITIVANNQVYLLIEKHGNWVVEDKI